MVFLRDRIVAGLTRAILGPQSFGPSDLTKVSPKLLSCNFVEPAPRVLKSRRIQIKRPLPVGVALLFVYGGGGGFDSGHPGLHPFGATLCVVQNYIRVVLSNPLCGFSSRAEYKQKGHSLSGWPFYLYMVEVASPFKLFHDISLNFNLLLINQYITDFTPFFSLILSHPILLNAIVFCGSGCGSW